ncbi:COP9 signalosome (CSN) subunit [Clydaea vesicula]|uniref:COP9 signalosome (CSN) subunit n=1 Tax=Clydaea vesicula TaxID=447962 RepID=A0AAD5UBI1_9FUNG|nr:COP9 signalosome (CSN) subunit [Clydaea vesicula]
MQETFLNHISNEDGNAVKSFFSLFDQNQLKIIINPNQLKKNIWLQLLFDHLQAKNHLLKSNFQTAFNFQNGLAQKFHGIFKDLHRWALPILYTINNDLFKLANEADILLIQQNQKPVNVEEGLRTSQKLDQTNLCKNITRALEASNLPELSLYPLSHRITYSYYQGMLLFSQENYKDSYMHFDFGFRQLRSSEEHSKNRVLFLKYLIPLNILKGIYPTKKLMFKPENYKLNLIYSNFVKSCSEGDLNLFDLSLIKFEANLVEFGTFNLIEKLRFVCLRNLFKKLVYVVGGNQLSLQYFLFAVKFSLKESEGDEEKKKENELTDDINFSYTDSGDVECKLANMIHNGLIKGYMDHDKQMIVLSKANPFPTLNFF